MMVLSFLALHGERFEGFSWLNILYIPLVVSGLF